MKNEKPLEPGTLIGQLTNPVKDKINNLFADRVVPSSVIVGGIFFARDQLFRVKKLSVGSGSNLIYITKLMLTRHNHRRLRVLTDNSWFQVNEDRTRHVLSCPSFTEESVEGVVSSSDGLIAWHLTVWLDAMFETVKFPARVTDLNPGLTDVDRDAFTL